MVKVKLNLLNIFQLKINEKSLEYEGKTVGDVVSQFIKQFSDKLDDGLLKSNKKRFNPQILILLNGKNIKYLNDLKTTLKEGDNIFLSYALAGG